MTIQTPPVATDNRISKTRRVKSAIARQIPDRRQVFPVFSLIVFFVFTWALYRISYQVPSWLGYLSLWNVILLLVYVLAAALVESVIMLGFVLFTCLVFPTRFFKEIFIAQGSALVVLLSLAALLIQFNISLIYSINLWQLIVYNLLFLVALAAMVLLFASLLKRLYRLRTLLEALATRMMVFGYCYTTIGLISLMVVLVRIIF